MTLRTPRRRISPRTRLKYRAIREFFRRALGNNSQQNIKINSSIAVNVTDLKRKIVGLEQQLGEVSKHCRDIVTLDQSRRESETACQSEAKQETAGSVTTQLEQPSELKSNGIETQVVYKASETQHKASEDSEITLNSHNDKDIKKSETAMNRSDGHVAKLTHKKSKLNKISNNSSKLYKHKPRYICDSAGLVYSTSSFHSLVNTRMNHSNTNCPRYSNDTRKCHKAESKDEMIPRHHKSHKYLKGDHIKTYYEDKTPKVRKSKKLVRDLDSDFIADIIQRQYKPVKMFHRKESMSQFSAPVCRDQELSLPECSKMESELCSCLHAGVSSHKRLRPRRQDFNTPSVCDARLHGSNNQLRHRHRKVPVEANSNSDLYDLVPVRERASPKSRRKFVEESRDPYEYYREVPPSPRTHRPRLNLKAQYYAELEDCMMHAKHPMKNHSPKLPRRYQNSSEQLESDVTSEPISIAPVKRIPQMQLPPKHMKVPVEEKLIQDSSRQDTTSTLPYQYSQYVNEQTSITLDTSLNKTQTTEVSVDKTDKALTEIKDILQSFLQEIKKETVTSQYDKSEITSKTPDDSNVLQDTNPNIQQNLLQNSPSYNNYTGGQCGVAPYVAPFPNPCCYQVAMPMCSLNCPMSVPPYVMPSQSFTCTNCAKTPKENNSTHCCNKSSEAPCNTETDELIKEIYKFVAQSPQRNKNNSNEEQSELKREESKILTSRSAGGSNKYYKQDAKVGTQPLKCYSRSCEAIGSRKTSDVYNTDTNESYSDSLLEKLSVEVTGQSYSETDITETVATTDNYKNKGNRFAKVLRSFGLFKKKKKDIIEEASESESVLNEQVRAEQQPFRQNITNYTMYEQEYFQPPPVDPLYQRPHDYLRPHEYQRHPHEYGPRWQEYQRHPHEYQPDYHPPYNPGVRGEPPPPLHDLYGYRYHPQMPDPRNDPAHGPKQRPTAPPFSGSYDSSYGRMQPALCLKEIEVKSTGTQSERRMSIFKKMKKKTKKPSGDEDQRTPKVSFSSQLKQVISQTKQKPSKPLFNWKNLQAKAMKNINDDVNFTLKTQQELADGDQKLRNALLKKLFNKRNPFSPRNKIVQTLLQKDKALMNDIPTIDMRKRPKLFY